MTHFKISIYLVVIELFAASVATAVDKVARKQVISNLNEHLDLFKECLVHLINFEGLDFKSFEQLVVLSRYIILSHKLLDALTTDEVESKNVTWTMLDSREDIILDILFNRPPLILKYDVMYINKNGSSRVWRLGEDYASKSKPWLCEAHVYLKPPTRKTFPQYYYYLKNDQTPALVTPWSFREFWKPQDRSFIINHRLECTVMVTSEESSYLPLPWYKTLDRWQRGSTNHAFLKMSLEQDMDNQQVIKRVYLVSLDRITAKSCSTEGPYSLLELGNLEPANLRQLIRSSSVHKTKHPPNTFPIRFCLFSR